MGESLSSEQAPEFPRDGKVMTVKVQCSHTGQCIDISGYMASRVTSEWTASHLKRAIELETGIHRNCQSLIFAGRMMDSRRTLLQVLGTRQEHVPDRVTIFMLADRSEFPMKLGPMSPVHVPFEAEDFILPELTDIFQHIGFYWELKTGILESHGLQARSARITGQVSPMHAVLEDDELRKARKIPEDAEYVVWSYPVVDWQHVECDAYAVDDWEGFEASAAMKSFLTVGGFLYLDGARRIVGATTPGRFCQHRDSVGGLYFREPRRWMPEWSQRLAEQGRFQPVTMRTIRELGARKFCWLRPREIIEDEDGAPLPMQPDVPHGGFVYLFHDDVLLSSKPETAMDRYFPVTPEKQSAREEYYPCTPGPGLFRPFSLVLDEKTESLAGVSDAPEWTGIDWSTHARQWFGFNSTDREDTVESALHMSTALTPRKVYNESPGSTALSSGSLDKLDSDGRASP